MKRSSFLLLALLAGAWCAAPARGAATFRPQSTAAPGSVPGGINYQGQLQENGIPVTAKWGFVFKLYASKEGGAALATYPPPPDNMNVDIISGMFSVNIPVTTNTLVGGGQRWLEIEVDKEGVAAGSGLVLTPREQLVSMPYALVAKTIEGSLDISTGGLTITTAPASTAAFYISSSTAFIGIGTANPATLLHMSSGTLTVDGPNIGGSSHAGIHLSSGPMVIDGDLGRLDVLGPAQFGRAGTQSSFNAAGALQLTSPLSLLYGGTGTNLSAAPLGAIPYFSALGVMSSLDLVGTGTILRSNGTIPAWTSASYPNSVAQGDLLYASAVNTVGQLAIGGNGAILRSSDTLSGKVPVWSLASYPDTVAQGDLLYGSAADTVGHLPKGAPNTILQAGAGTLAWTAAQYPTSVATGELLYGSAADTVGKLGWVGTATRYLANTGGAGTVPAWDQVDLTNGVKNLLPISNGGTGANLSLGGKDARGSVPFFNSSNVMDTLGPTTAGYVLTTSGAGADPTWKDLTTGATVYTAKHLLGGEQGSVPFQNDVGRTSMLAPVADGRILMSQGPAADVIWTTAKYPLSTTNNQILYSNADNNVTGLATQVNGVLVTDSGGTPLIGTDIPTAVTIGAKYIYRQGGTQVPFADGGTNNDLSGLAAGSLIYLYDDAGVKKLGGATLTGVLQGNGAGAPTALTGTTDYNAYWSDPNTLAAEQYTPMSRGGTSKNLSTVATGALIYKAASNLEGTTVLTGVLKMNGASAPEAMSATTGYSAYWSDDYTIAGEAQTALSRGGTNADLSTVDTGGLIYKAAAGLAGTGALTGILKGTGGLPIAITATAGYSTYWSDDNTIAGEAQTALSRGGTNADLSAVTGGALIYMGAGELAATGALTGILQGTGAAPTALTGTTGYNTYWLDANTIAAEQYTAMSRGGTGSNLSAVARGGLIYKDTSNLAGSAIVNGVLKGNDTGAPTGMTGTTNYNTYWFDANTIKAEQFTAMSRGGTGQDLSTVNQGGLIYKKDASSLDGTAALTGVLKGNDTSAPTAMTGTANYNTYWSTDYAIAAERYAAMSRGGTGKDLSTADTWGLIYKAASNLEGTAALTGVLKVVSPGTPTAMTGTIDYNAYWSDANTIAARLYIGIANGGTGANLPTAATGGLIYKKTATTLDGTAALTGIIKGNDTSAPTALTGTIGYNAYWSDANTIGARLYIPLANGGTGANLPTAATGGLIYKKDANTLDGTLALTGILKGNNTGAPTALTGTVDYNAYWSDANTIAARLYIPLANGGTGADLPTADTGGLIYKKDASTLDGTGALTGVLKGNSGSPPTGDATLADLAETATYKRYAPGSVAITGGTIGGTTLVGVINVAKAAIATLDPTYIGEIYFCTNCGSGKIIVSYGTSAGEFRDAMGDAP